MVGKILLGKKIVPEIKKSELQQIFPVPIKIVKIDEKFNDVYFYCVRHSEVTQVSDFLTDMKVRFSVETSPGSEEWTCLAPDPLHSHSAVTRDRLIKIQETTKEIYRFRLEQEIDSMKTRKKEEAIAKETKRREEERKEKEREAKKLLLQEQILTKKIESEKRETRKREEAEMKKIKKLELMIETEKIKEEKEKKRVARQELIAWLKIEAEKIRIERMEEKRNTKRLLLEEIAKLEEAKHIKKNNDKIKKMKAEIEDIDRELEADEMEMDDSAVNWESEAWGSWEQGTTEEYELRGDTIALKSSRRSRVFVGNKPFAKGSFRIAYRAKGESGEQLIAKVHKKASNREQACQDDLETILISQYFAEQFNREKKGKSLRFVSCYLFRLDAIKTNYLNSNILIIESSINGTFTKYNNNAGYIGKALGATAHAFSHFSWCKSGKQLMIVDIQGCKERDEAYILTDPAIHHKTKTLGDSNLGEKGFTEFFRTHKCNKVCEEMRLEKHSTQTLEIDDAGTVCSGY